MSVFNRNRKIPRVVIEDKNLEKAIGYWLGSQINVGKKFGEVLINVGFKPSDEIVLCKYQEKTLSFNYIVNGNNPYKKNTIWLSYKNDYNNNSHIIVTTGSKNTRSRMVYEVERTSSNKIGDKYHVFSYLYEDKRYGMISRRYYENKAEFFVEKDDYELYLSVEKNDNLFIKQGSDGVYRIKNEKELISYLTSLTFPVEIDLVYKKICEISLGDINIYPEFCLKVTKYDTLKNLEEVTDIIELEDGNLISFGMSKDGKNVVLYGDGSWCYEKKLSDITAVIQYEDDEYMYGSITDGGFGNEVKQINKKEIKNIAIKDIEETKGLVRRLLNRGDRKYDR